MQFASHFVTHTDTQTSAVGSAVPRLTPATSYQDSAAPLAAHPRRPSLARLAVIWALAAVCGSLIVQISSSLPSGIWDQYGLGAATPSPAEPVDRSTAVAISRAVLMRLDDANRTGNYSVFRDMSAPDFQAINSAGDLKRIFSWIRSEGLTLSSSASLEASSLHPATLEKGGILHLRGGLSDIPGGLSFDLLMQYSDAGWRVFGIAVYRG